MTKDEALKLALETLECWQRNEDCNEPMSKILEAIKEALAEPEQEPVAWFSTLPDGRLSIKIVGKPTEGNWEPLYTTPPQRTWAGLTNEEVMQCLDQGYGINMRLDGFARIIEAKLKEKNT